MKTRGERITSAIFAMVAVGGSDRCCRYNVFPAARGRRGLDGVGGNVVGGRMLMSLSNRLNVPDLPFSTGAR